jgi:hypothetical protein
MKLRYAHRIWVYGIVTALLVAYIATKDANLYSVFTHVLPGVLGLEAGNAMAEVK